MIPYAYLWKRPREKSRMIWKCNGLIQSLLSMDLCFPAPGPSHHRAELTPAADQPLLTCLLKHWAGWAGMENTVFMCSPSTSLHFCCHGYKNEAITLFRISYFYCNYATGNYLIIFPFISPTVYLCYDASSACAEPPSTDLLLVGGCSLPWVWVLMVLGSEGSAQLGRQQQPMGRSPPSSTTQLDRAWHCRSSQPIINVDTFFCCGFKCSCVAGGCSSLCLSVSAAQDHWQVCVKAGSGKQNGGKNLLGS